MFWRPNEISSACFIPDHLPTNLEALVHGGRGLAELLGDPLLEAAGRQTQAVWCGEV